MKKTTTTKSKKSKRNSLVQVLNYYKIRTKNYIKQKLQSVISRFKYFIANVKDTTGYERWKYLLVGEIIDLIFTGIAVGIGIILFMQTNYLLKGIGVALGLRIGFEILEKAKKVFD